MIKSYTRIAIAAVSLALLGAAHAGTETVTITSPAAAPLRGLYPTEGDALVGHYLMSDGRILSLKKSHNYILADLDGVPLTRLMAAEPRTLRSADDSMQLRFEADPRAEGAQITVSLRADGNPGVRVVAAHATGR